MDGHGVLGIDPRRQCGSVGSDPPVLDQENLVAVDSDRLGLPVDQWPRPLGVARDCLAWPPTPARAELEDCIEDYLGPCLPQATSGPAPPPPNQPSARVDSAGIRGLPLDQCGPFLRYLS